MLRILFGSMAFALYASGTFACEGQTGKVIFEDKFTDDAGGWSFGDDLILNAPGATFTLEDSDDGNASTFFNETFTATQGDFCVEMTFPLDAAKVDAGINVVFWGVDDSNYWDVYAGADGAVSLGKWVDDKWSTIFETTTNNLVKIGPTDVNSVHAIVKNGTITVVVNGQTVKTIRAQIPSENLKFGFRGEYDKSSSKPVLFSVRSYKVTAPE